MILKENEVINLFEKIKRFSKAEEISVNISGSNSYNIRFARNTVSTNGYSDGLTVSVTSYFGKKSGSASTNKFDNESLKNIVELSENIAKLSPENKEYVSLLNKQEYLTVPNYSEYTEKRSEKSRSDAISYIIENSINNHLVSAGYIEDEVSFTSIFNSKNLFAYNKNTESSISSTIRTEDGSGSSRFSKLNVNVNNIDYKNLTDFSIRRTLQSIQPKELKPGRYTVILEHSASADMISLCMNFMGARSADEGRSYFSKKGGGNLVNEKIVSSLVNIYSDPSDIKAPSIPFTGEGEPRNKVVWFENGVLKNLHRNRYWAEKTNEPSIPYPSNIIMEGTSKTLDQIISETDYGILVSRFWYIRTVEQKTMLLTGLTRDGIFEVKDGKITNPIKNFRFNESPINILKNIIDLGVSEKSPGSETGNFSICVPIMKVKDFNFSSLSDAV
jgi:predicted Zn-dependent protease